MAKNKSNVKSKPERSKAKQKWEESEVSQEGIENEKRVRSRSVGLLKYGGQNTNDMPMLSKAAKLKGIYHERPTN